MEGRSDDSQRQQHEVVLAIVVTDAVPVSLDMSSVAIAIAETGPMSFSERIQIMAAAAASQHGSEEISPLQVTLSTLALLILMGGAIWLFILVHQMQYPEP